MTTKATDQARAALKDLEQQRLVILRKIADVANRYGTETQEAIKACVHEVTEKGSKELSHLSDELHILGTSDRPQNTPNNLSSILPSFINQAFTATQGMNQDLSELLAVISAASFYSLPAPSVCISPSRRSTKPSTTFK